MPSCSAWYSCIFFLCMLTGATDQAATRDVSRNELTTTMFPKLGFQKRVGNGLAHTGPQTKTHRALAPSASIIHCNMASIVLVGASGFIGKATVRALVAAGKAVTVATRNPASAASAEFTSAGATVVKGDLNDAASLVPVFTGAAAGYIITPGSEVCDADGTPSLAVPRVVLIVFPRPQDRTTLAINGINAAKSAGLPFLTVLSVATADKLDTVFGRQFTPIEEATKASGIPFTILRLPMFTDNFW